jgi:hypothetical protein
MRLARAGSCSSCRLRVRGGRGRDGRFSTLGAPSKESVAGREISILIQWVLLDGAPKVALERGHETLVTLAEMR